MNNTILHDDRKRVELDIFVKLIEAGAAIEFPTVPRANQVVAVQISLPQRTPCVRARAFDAVQLTLDIADCIAGLARFDLFDGAGREFRQGLHLQQRHNPTIARSLDRTAITERYDILEKVLGHPSSVGRAADS